MDGYVRMCGGGDKARMENDALLIRLPQLLLALLVLLLQHLQLPRQALVLRAVLRALVRRALGVRVQLLELLHLGLEQAVLVLHGRDFLLFLQVLLLERLHFGLRFFQLGGGFVGFDAEGGHALEGAMLARGGGECWGPGKG